MTKEKENLQFRYLYAFGILFVVLSHCDGGGIQMLSNWMHFGAFHLAIFVFGSGYFFHADKISNPFSYVGKKIKTLLLPLWGWNLVYGLVVTGLHFIGFQFGEIISLRGVILGPVINKDLYHFNMGSWFVFPFFMVQILYACIKWCLDKIGKNTVTDKLLQFAFVAAGIRGVHSAGKGLDGEWQFLLMRILYFMPFYVLGIWYREKLESFNKKIPTMGILGGCLVVALLLNTYFGRVVYAIPSTCDYPFGTFATYIAALVGIVFWLQVSGWLAEYGTPIPILKIIGNSTWDIMIHQFAGIFAVKCMFGMLNRFFRIFADFDWQIFMQDIWYLYRPKGMAEYAFLYVIGAIAFSVLVKGIMQKVKESVVFRKQVK